jgi:hypothetical protein
MHWQVNLIAAFYFTLIVRLTFFPAFTAFFFGPPFFPPDVLAVIVHFPFLRPVRVQVPADVLQVFVLLPFLAITVPLVVAPRWLTSLTLTFPLLPAMAVIETAKNTAMTINASVFLGIFIPFRFDRPSSLFCDATWGPTIQT